MEKRKKKKERRKGGKEKDRKKEGKRNSVQIARERFEENDIELDRNSKDVLL